MPDAAVTFIGHCPHRHGCTHALLARGGGSADGQVNQGGVDKGCESASNCMSNRPAQITGTEAEPQQIVAQRLLSCLQYHVP